MMTHEQIAAVIIAHGQGKKLQHKDCDLWYQFHPDHGLDYLLKRIKEGLIIRVAPDPKLRPWRPEEGVGKVVRYKKDKELIRVITDYANGQFKLDIYAYTPSLLIETYEQLDGKPCGVEESE